MGGGRHSPPPPLGVVLGALPLRVLSRLRQCRLHGTRDPGAQISLMPHWEGFEVGKGLSQIEVHLFRSRVGSNILGPGDVRGTTPKQLIYSWQFLWVLVQYTEQGLFTHLLAVSVGPGSVY